MNVQKLTQKSIEAVQAAQQYAVEHGQSEVRQAHLLHGLLTEQDGLIPSMLQGMDVDVKSLRAACDAILEKLPRMSGGSGEAYEEQELEGGDTRVVMHFHPALAPYKCAVLPLQKNKCGEKAGEVYDMLAKHFMVDYDETGSIGKRYRRQDEIGTPMCITVDFDTLETGVVTVRDRDTMEQEHVHIDELVAYIQKKIEY